MVFAWKRDIALLCVPVAEPQQKRTSSPGLSRLGVCEQGPWDLSRTWVLSCDDLEAGGPSATASWVSTWDEQGSRLTLGSSL